MSGLTKEQHPSMAIDALVSEVARLTRERNALLVGMLTAHLAPHDHLVEGILAAPEKRAAAVGGTIENVVKVGYGRYLDLPSDLGKTS